jgi:hypothetical protein
MPKFKLLNLTTRCDSTCMVCAKEFWQWLKSRETQMNMPLKSGTSFAKEAAKSGNMFKDTTEQAHMATGVASNAPTSHTPTKGNQ